MKTCPYCKLVSFTRKQHVAHLISAHPADHHKNLVTCGTSQSVPTPSSNTAASSAALSPRRNHPIGTPSITHPDSNYSALVAHLSKRSLPCSIPSAQMELVYNGCNNRIGLTFTDGSQYELVHLDYCPGFICQYPGPPTDYDDRHKDWGCRGRTNNVACRGHPSWGTGLRFDQFTQHTVTLPPPTVCSRPDSPYPSIANDLDRESSCPIPPLRRDVSISSSSSMITPRSFSPSPFFGMSYRLHHTNSCDARYNAEVNDGWN